ncbi:hypothetical protein AAFC00_004548 [Neodothiora populina]|uniref:Major facilitator superfamily transporter n=1 Tax=Neodothiora populina TaxID=2781224 RepID=A0ABR3P2C7_9PEZI
MSAVVPIEDSALNAQMWPPGTARLEETGLGSSAKDDKIILQPQPTDDPNDPLNWPIWRKYVNFGLSCFWVAMVGEFINAAGPTWGAMHRELGFSFEVLNDSYAAGCAALAVGGLVLIPFALKFGRRPLYLSSTMLQFGCSIWSAKMQTVADIVLINILQCGFGALAEVIVQMTIADLFFVHQRGKMNSVYVWIWYFSSYLGPLIAGFIAVDEGWRWIWWWNVIFFGIAMFVVGFCYEETKYSPVAMSSAFSMDQLLSTDGRTGSDPASSTKFRHEVKDTTEVTAKDGKRNADMTDDNRIALHGPPEVVAEVWSSSQDIYAVKINPSIPRKTYWQRLALFSTTSSGGGVSTYIGHMYQPLVLLVTIPAIAWVALVYGILGGLQDVMATELSTYLTEAPYNFNSDQIGLLAIPQMIGVTIGTLVPGPLSDWIVIYLSRRNNGIYEPEMRLWCIIPFLVFAPAGALMFGFGLNNGLPWPVIAVGLALYNVGMAPINSISITYLTDSYQNIVGDALVGVTLVRNCFSTAFVFALTPWVDAVGLKYTVVTCVVIACVILAFLGVFIKWGKTFRVRSAERYHRYAQRQYKERAL